MRTESFNYLVYGFIISADRKIAGYIKAPEVALPDVTLNLGRGALDFGTLKNIYRLNSHIAASPQNSPLPPDNGQQNSNIFYYKISYWNKIEFIVKSTGTEVWARWPDSVDFNLVTAYFSGPILGLILKLRGALCLHASVVEIDRHAIAIVAPTGGGKSTTAVALALKGYSILSDDILVLKKTPDTYFAQPGYPGVRLCHDSTATLFPEGRNSLKLTVSDDKHYVVLPQAGCRFCQRPRPLAVIYTGGLDKLVTTPEIETLSHKKAFKTLLFHTYPGNYYRLPASLRAEEMDHLNHLSREIPLRQVNFQRVLSRLPELCDAIVADAKNCISSLNQSNTL